MLVILRFGFERFAVADARGDHFRHRARALPFAVDVLRRCY